MSDVERERDYYRGECDRLGAQALRLQAEQLRAQREAARSRMSARLVREAYALVGRELSLYEVGPALLEVIVGSLQADRGAVFSSDTGGRQLRARYSWGFPRAEIPDLEFPGGVPGFARAGQRAVEEAVSEALRRTAGLPHVLWAYDPRTRIGLLVASGGDEWPLGSPFDDTDRELIEGALSVFVEIRERKQMERALRDRERRLRDQNQTLVRLAREGAGEDGGLPDVLRRITETSAHTLGVERVSVWFYTPDREAIRAADLYQRSINEHSAGEEVRAATCPAYFAALASARTIAADDAVTDPRTRELRESYLEPRGITSMLDAPVRAGGQIVGVLCHEHVGPLRRWALDEQSFAGSLADLVSLAVETSRHWRLQKHLAALNECFLAFGSDPRANIDRLVALCGDMLGADCVLYNRLQGRTLCVRGSWHAPEDLASEDHAEGHVCADVIQRGLDEPVVIRNLLATPYAESDPNVRRYGLQTYIGRAVNLRGTPVGSLCALFTSDRVPEETDLHLLTAVASAIGVEEDRQQAAAELLHREKTAKCLAEVSSQLLRSSDLRATLAQVLQELREVFGADCCYWLRNSQGPRGEPVGQWELIAPGDKGVCEDGHEAPEPVRWGIAGLGRWAKALAAGETVWGRTDQFDGAERAWLDSRGVTGLVLLPLRVANRWRGAIGIETQQPDLEWTEHDVSVLRAAALAVSSALDRHAAEEQRRAFTRLALGLAGAGSLESIAHEVTEATAVLVGGDCHCFYVLEGSLKAFVRRGGDPDLAAVGEATEPDDWPDPPPQVRERLLAGQPVLIGPDPGGLGPGDQPTGVPTSALYVPIRGEQAVIGAIAAFSNVPGTFGAEETEVLLRVAAAVAPALERVFSRRALEATERRLRELADLLPDMVFEADAEGRVHYANQRVTDALGYDAADISRGILVTDVLHPEEVERARADMASLTGQGGVLTGDYRVRRKDGKYLSCAISAAPIRGPEGEYLGLRGVVHDLTERLRAQEADRLAAVGQLAAGVAHEFNNLLAAISGRAELAQSWKTPEAYEKLVSVVQTASARGAEVCRNLLGFARPDVPSMAPVLIQEVADAALAMAARELERAQVEVVRRWNTGGRRVLGDSGQLVHVFLNLIINACHAMPNGGRLEITANLAETVDGLEEIVTTVSDNGTGIAPEHLPRIFEPFFTTKGRYGEGGLVGAGLGLSVCHGIVQAHHGSLSVHSELGVGTTFELRLAACSPPEQTAGSLSGALLRFDGLGDGLRALVAEDEEPMRSIMCEILAHAGFDVTAAADAETAVGLLRKSQHDVVITDMMMPQGGGRAILAAAGALAAPPPVIVVTGRGDQETVAAAMALGAQECLAKPFGLDELLAAAARALGRDTELGL